MPKDALADILREWEQIHSAMGALDLLNEPHLRKKWEEIGAMLDYTKGLAAEQLSLTARRQTVTKELRIAKSQGKDLIVQARGLLRAHLGHRNEGLVAFNMRPIRRRSRAMPEDANLPGSALAKALAAAGATGETVEDDPTPAGTSAPLPAEPPSCSDDAPAADPVEPTAT